MMKVTHKLLLELEIVEYIVIDVVLVILRYYIQILFFFVV